MKYCYVFNYREMDRELFEMECRQLFQDVPNGKILVSDQDVSCEHSPFLHEKLTVLAEGKSCEELVSHVIKLELESEQYKVIFLGKMEHGKVDYQLQLKLCKDCGNAIEGSFSLHNPKVLFGILYHENHWYFGIAEKMEKRWLKHQSKPHSYSYSLPVRLARILISIAGKNDRSRKLIDPCAGAGTVILEGLHLGYDIEGMELNPLIAADANQNCTYYGYPEVIECRDMMRCRKHADCVILDIPYGVMETTDEIMQRNLLRGCAQIADELVLVSIDPMTEMLKETGWRIDEQAPFVKQRFVRYVTICTRQNVEKAV